jgi:anti-sigma B factor antagonist
MDLSFTIRAEPEGTVVRIHGDLDVVTASKLRERLADLIRRGHHDVIVDLEHVAFVDSSGLAVLVNALKRARAHDGSVRLVCTNEPLLQIFRITGLNRTFTIYATTDAALAAVEYREAPPGLWVRPRSLSSGHTRAGRRVRL